MTNARNKSGTNGGTFVARLVAGESPARRVADFMAETLDPAEVVCAAFERPDKRWQVDLHFRDCPEPTGLRTMIALAGGDKLASTLVVEKVAPRDWVKDSLIGLRPVTAGRFVVHGAHDRARVPSHCVSVEIEAATAFGTGHHGTTRGCLLALDSLARRRQRPRRILDIGTGTGVLAIAAAKIFHVPVLAVDIDPRAAMVARANAQLNGVGSLVTVVHAAGLRAPDVVKRAPFDLVLANILLRPLQRLAAPVARQLVPNARVVISGVLTAQANAALAAYRSQGLMLERSFTLDGWVTPVMVALSA
ncbi:MAG: ribosomal protein methyltransferase [Alphaproteobacteria bacterium]|nr:ribosomal protein methyltransferase [Alphaproteobacteria bacterium]